jgi:hypothetical protein
MHQTPRASAVISPQTGNAAGAAAEDVTNAQSNMARGAKQQAAAAGPLRALQMQMEREGLLQQQQQDVAVLEAGSGSSSSQALAAKRGRKSSSKAAGAAAAAAAAEFAVEDHKQEGACIVLRSSNLSLELYH